MEPCPKPLDRNIHAREGRSFNTIPYYSFGDTVSDAAVQRTEPGDGAWATPALFLRSPDGRLFAPRSTVWARRAALLAGLAVALALVWILAAGWLRERRTAEVMRLNNEVMRLNTEGAVLAKQGRNEEARKTLLSVLELDPDNAAALGNLATVEMKLGYDEAALVHAQAAVRASPKEAVYHYKLGNLLALKKRYEEALLSLQQAIEIDPHYANAYNELGDIYLELDRPTEARKAFEDGLRCDPTPAARLSSPEDLRTLAKLHKNLARAALAEGHPEEAIHHLETALPLYSPAESAGKAEATYWLATAYAKAGRTTEACVALRKFEVLSPGLLSELAEKATLLMKQERCTRGLD